MKINARCLLAIHMLDNFSGQHLSHGSSQVLFKTSVTTGRGSKVSGTSILFHPIYLESPDQHHADMVLLLSVLPGLLTLGCSQVFPIVEGSSCHCEMDFSPVNIT
jgi:hypothetical protein